jgi:hypothetical protein
MKCSNLFTVFLATVALGCAAPYPRKPSYELTGVDALRARDIIAAEDNPRLLSDSFGDHRYLSYNDNTTGILNQLIEHNRINSFMSFFPRVNFGAFSWKRIGMLFYRAARAHRFEICDYLMSQEFRIGDAWYESLQDWDIIQLKNLLAGHHTRILEMTPGHWTLCYDTNAAVILIKLEIIEYCRSINPDFANKPEYHPTNLLRNVIRNEKFDDADLARILSKILSMGPTVDKEIVESFKASHPFFDDSNQLLFGYLDTPIKEPGFD